jgi:Transglycosylase SLT domain
LSLTRTTNRKSATVKAALTAAGTAVATTAVAVAALVTAGPAAGSLSGLGSAGAQAQVAQVTSITHDAAQEAAAASAAKAARQTAHKMLGHFGWGNRQFGPLVKLWNRESGWNKYAYNASSGAYGIPQAVPGSKMASAGKHWRTNATTQIRWGLRYIKSRYGRPRRAWDHELAYGWY